MQVTFMRWHGQDSAVVCLGSPLEAYRKGIGSPGATQAGLDADAAAGELSFVTADLQPGEVIDVGHLI